MTGEKPEYYYYLLDMYYYLVDMENLRSFYRSQELLDFRKEPERIFEYYSNLETVCLDSDIIKKSPFYKMSLDFMLYPLGYDYRLLLGNKSFFESLYIEKRKRDRNYYNEVSDIVTNMVKTSKHNEMVGNSPTIV